MSAPGLRGALDGLAVILVAVGLGLDRHPSRFAIFFVGVVLLLAMFHFWPHRRESP